MSETTEQHAARRPGGPAALLLALERETLQRQQDEAIQQANRLHVSGFEAGIDIPMGCMRVTFSDGSHVLMSKAQLEAIRA